jgi:hypothetical protein
VGGNHDHYSTAGIEPQIDYAAANPGTKWNFPAHYYSKSITQNGISIFVVFIDTWDLVGGDSANTGPTGRPTTRAPSTSPTNAPGTIGRRLEKTTDERRDLSVQTIQDPTQLNWIQAQLNSTAAQTAHWLIVVGHYPVRSAAKKGDTVALAASLEPILIQSKVDAYFSGHAHVHQIIDRKDGSPVYYGNGAAGKNDSGELTGGAPGLIFYQDQAYGYFSHTFNKTHMTTTIHYISNITHLETTYTFVQSSRIRSQFSAAYSIGNTIGCMMVVVLASLVATQ